VSRSSEQHGVSRSGEPLAPLPSQEQILGALHGFHGLARAEQVARALGVVGSRRLGTKSSKGNWSGGMKAGVRLAPRLMAMHRAGLVVADYDRDDHVWKFRLPREGEEVRTHYLAVRKPPPPRVERRRKRKPGAS
jgi:hypothetical protein